MTRHQELVLADFKPVELPDNQSYLSARIGQYEVTLEPHLITGYCIGIYYGNDCLALEKRAFWLKNHPNSEVPATIPSRVVAKALEYANQLLEKYHV